MHARGAPCSTASPQPKHSIIQTSTLTLTLTLTANPYPNPNPSQALLQQGLTSRTMKLKGSEMQVRSW